MLTGFLDHFGDVKVVFIKLECFRQIFKHVVRVVYVLASCPDSYL